MSYKQINVYECYFYFAFVYNAFIFNRAFKNPLATIRTIAFLKFLLTPSLCSSSPNSRYEREEQISRPSDVSMVTMTSSASSIKAFVQVPSFIMSGLCQLLRAASTVIGPYRMLSRQEIHIFMQTSIKLEKA